MAKVKFVERTEAPKVSNKYYIRKEGGGYVPNYIISGNPETNKEKNRQSPNSVLPNCVGYCYARSMEVSKRQDIVGLPYGHAKTWFSSSTWKKTQAPVVGAICCYGGREYGHVCFVEAVDDNGTGFTISESGYTSFYWRRRHLTNASAYGSGLQFQGFLINPYVDTTTSFLPSKGYWCKGDKDVRVGQLCQFLYDTFPSYAKVLKRNKEDLLGNLYGTNCEAWIKEFQRNVGLTPTGRCGKKTYAQLKKYKFKG